MEENARQALRKYVLTSGIEFDLAVTLTMKQQDGATTLDGIEASKNLRHFLNRLNKKAFGNASDRFGRRVHVVPVLEKSYAGRLHYHLAMENPFPSLLRCDMKIRECRAQTRWGYNEIEIKPIYYLAGWTNYITKSRSTVGWDIENTHFDSLI